MNDFSDCIGLICSAGFGACSEAIHYGKNLLVVPLQGQMEQLSNAAALEQLNQARVHDIIRHQDLESWLTLPSPEAYQFPDVAPALADWIIKGQKQTLKELSQSLWDEVGSAIPTRTTDSSQAMRATGTLYH